MNEAATTAAAARKRGCRCCCQNVSNRSLEIAAGGRGESLAKSNLIHFNVTSSCQSCLISYLLRIASPQTVTVLDAAAINIQEMS